MGPILIPYSHSLFIPCALDSFSWLQNFTLTLIVRLSGSVLGQFFLRLLASIRDRITQLRRKGTLVPSHQKVFLGD